MIFIAVMTLVAGTLTSSKGSITDHHAAPPYAVFRETSACGEPDQLNAILASFQPLAGLEGHASPALLHEFLEVDEEFSAWFSGHMRRRRMVAGRDYCMLRPGAGTHIGDRLVEGLGLSPMMAAKVAAATSTVRGRKMKACLIEPGVTSIDLDKNDPALLELLFTPPIHGSLSPEVSRNHQRAPDRAVAIELGATSLNRP